MGKRKIRNFLTVSHVESIFDHYFDTHRDEVIKYMIETVNHDYNKNFKNIYELSDFDIHGGPMGGFGLDCGWVWLKSKIEGQRHEWFLDNDRIPNYAAPRNWPYPTQSTTLKSIQLQKALDDLSLNDFYRLYVKLD